jgi:ribosomal protein S27E
MARKKKVEYHSYYEGRIRYMSCQVCGRYETVGESATSVKCSNCVTRSIPLDKPTGYVPTGRPAGWHWRKEFVDTDGTVYHLGKEQPKLKGTLKPTKVKPPKKKVKRRTKQQVLIDRHKEKKAALKKAVKKQKDFLNHNINKERKMKGK